MGIMANKRREEIKLKVLNDYVGGQTRLTMAAEMEVAVPQRRRAAQTLRLEMESRIAEEAARRAVIENHLSTSENHKRMAAEELNHIHSKSAVEQARSIGYGVGSTAAGLVGAPGMIADLAGWFAANGAQDAVELTEQLAAERQNRASAPQTRTPVGPTAARSDMP